MDENSKLEFFVCGMCFRREMGGALPKCESFVVDTVTMVSDPVRVCYFMNRHGVMRMIIIWNIRWMLFSVVISSRSSLLLFFLSSRWTNICFVCGMFAMVASLWIMIWPWLITHFAFAAFLFQFFLWTTEQHSFCWLKTGRWPVNTEHVPRSLDDIFSHSLAHSRSPNPAKSLCEWADNGTFCSTSTCEKSFMCHLMYSVGRYCVQCTFSHFTFTSYFI